MPDDTAQLLAAIREMAAARKAEVTAEADQEVAKINEAAEAQIRQLRDDALARLEDQLLVESECIVGRAELEMRDRLIHQKNEALREVFERAGRQIDALRDAGTYRETFKRLIQEAIGRMNREDVRLRISKADLPLWETLKGQFPASVSVGFSDGPKGIVVVETDDGSQSIDNSIETRLETAREVMRRELSEVLFDAEILDEKGK